MRVANWEDYELIDASSGEKLERWKDIILIRPDPQVIWNTPRENPLWKSAHARYQRSSSGGGSWQVYKTLPPDWTIAWNDLKFRVKTMGFKHTGIFPEQAVNWDYASEKIRKAGREVKVLNLFGYTGAATVACLKAGASVCHVDASRGMVTWARENSVVSGVSEQPVRWIVDDCVKFAAREVRRGSRYDAIIMDPPSYGRGPAGEIWRLEDNIFALVETCAQLLSEDALFFMLNSYTAGLSPSVMEYILGVLLKKPLGGRIRADEIGLRASESGLVLPCGSTAIWER